MLFLWQPLQDTVSQGMRQIWPSMTRSQSIVDNVVEKDGCVNGHRGAGTEALQ